MVEVDLLLDDASDASFIIDLFNWFIHILILVNSARCSWFLPVVFVVGNVSLIGS